ncbi:PAS/PAC sensor hybrid histidine kinase [Candidatus Magnetoovum chiemensis]|nr:PAS/PAC sensor hybrid histidine kinase [Candidatus Magnetoovum chiemensis]
MLERLGYKVLSAAAPKKAVEITSNKSEIIDLVITDVIMPEMNGKELIEKLRSINPALKYMFMSGYTANVIAHHGVLDKNVNFIQKPFSIYELSVKIRNTLEKC